MKLKIYSARRSVAGFSLMEIMLVLAIISLLLAVVIGQGSGFLGQAKEVRVDADISTITTALGAYESRNLFLPTTEQGLQALVTKPTSEPVPKRWGQLLPQMPKDPWGMPYQYMCPGKHNPSKCDIYSFGPDRKESEDDLGNWEKK